MSEPTGSGPRRTHLSAAELDAFLRDELPAPVAEAAAAHLETCAACMTALDQRTEPTTAPPEPEGAPTVTTTAILERDPAAAPPAWDERRMRRSVRRTLLGTATRAAVLLLLLLLLAQLLGALVVHPLLIDRGDRLVAHVAATMDLPVLTIPGAEIGEYRSTVGTVRRTTEVEVQRAVGASITPLGAFTTRISPFGMGGEGGAPLGSPPASVGDAGATADGPLDFEAARLGPGTAVTVELVWQRGRSAEEAQTLADADDATTLLWVGFQVPGADAADPTWRLGYSTCGRVPTMVTEHAGASFGGSGGFRSHGEETGVRHALAQVRRATANLAAFAPFEAADGTALEDPEATAAALADADPTVTSLVVTGPTDAVAALVDAAGADLAHLLEVDFDRGAPEPCG